MDDDRSSSVGVREVASTVSRLLARSSEGDALRHVSNRLDG